MIIKRISRIGNTDNAPLISQKVEKEIENIHKVLNSIGITEDANGNMILAIDKGTIKRNDAYFIQNTVNRTISDLGIDNADNTPPDNTAGGMFLHQLI